MDAAAEGRILKLDLSVEVLVAVARAAVCPFLQYVYWRLDCLCNDEVRLPIDSAFKSSRCCRADDARWTRQRMHRCDLFSSPYSKIHFRTRQTTELTMIASSRLAPRIIWSWDRRYPTEDTLAAEQSLLPLSTCMSN